MKHSGLIRKAANRITQQKRSTRTKDDTQIPQICVSPSGENSEANQKRGQSPNQTPTTITHDLPSDTGGRSHCFFCSFFRPTPHSSRQVVHHACKPVAYSQIRLIYAKPSSIFIANLVALNTVLKAAFTILDRLLPLTAPAPWLPMYRNATAHDPQWKNSMHCYHCQLMRKSKLIQSTPGVRGNSPMMMMLGTNS